MFSIKDPQDLKTLNIVELEKVASETRNFLINSVSKTGGHLGSNLGVVELTMALHYCFDSPKDKIIFDVGHQCYVHKLMTGRAEGFSTLRQFGGMSGFVKRGESIHDVWEAGHSSTSISAASGFAYARDLDQAKTHVVAVIGDGSMTNGMSMEALNHIAHLRQRVVIILNDNEKSIGNNVGFINDIFKNISYSTDYNKTKRKVRKTLKHVPLGNKMAKTISAGKAIIKNQVHSSQTFFELLGFEYLLVEEGHNFNKLIKALEFSKTVEGPIVIHVKTDKGRGYAPAVKNSWHGVPPFNVETGKPLSVKTGISYSKVVANYLENRLETDKDVVVITPAMGGGSELNAIEKRFTNNFTDVGIAEEHALTFAAALALAGKKPFVSIYSTFLQRAFDQVQHDIIRQNANVVIGVDRAGLVGDDGETHQGIYDISMFTPFEPMTICQGKDDFETRALLDYCFKTDGPMMIRYPRGGNFEACNDFEVITNTNWIVERSSNTKYIITYGNYVNELLNSNLDSDIGVINARFIKPIDKALLEEIKDKEIYVVEEHANTGALNTLISDYYNNSGCAKVITKLNFNSSFVLQGNVDLLKKDYQLDIDSLVERVEK